MLVSLFSLLILSTITANSLLVVVSINTLFNFYRAVHKRTTRSYYEKTFYHNYENVVDMSTVRKLRTILRGNEARTSWSVQRLIKKFETTDPVGNAKLRRRSYTQRNDQQVSLVQTK